jgi:N,N-dimethylformamidase
MRGADGRRTARIDPSRLDLARDFRARPFGAHGVELQQILHRMRSGPIEGRLFLMMTRPHAEWTLARMSTEPPLRPIVIGPSFTDLAAAEWHVFKLRWAELTGQALAID